MSNDSGLLETIDDLTEELKMASSSNQELIHVLGMASKELDWYAPKETITTHVKKTLSKYKGET